MLLAEKLTNRSVVCLKNPFYLFERKRINSIVEKKVRGKNQEQ